MIYKQTVIENKPLRVVFALKVFRTNLAFCHILPSLSRNLYKLSTKPAKRITIIHSKELANDHIKSSGRTVYDCKSM